jgi:TRAP-type C4-dicarboxylate transport system permease small subunit
MKRFWKVFDKIVDAMAAIAWIMLLFICAASCYTIGMRFFFTRTTIWIMQTTEYALLWMVFLSTTWLLREKGHITTDLVYEHLSEKTKWLLDVITFTLSGLACAVLFYYSAAYTYDSIIGGVTDVRAVTVPKWTVYIIIPIGSLFLIIQFFRMAGSRLSELRAGR